MNKFADVNNDIHKLVNDLEKKVITDVMGAIFRNQELLNTVLPNNSYYKFSILTLMLTAAMTGATSAATLIRAMSDEPLKDKTILFTDDDLAEALGYLVSLMHSRLSNNPTKESEDLSAVIANVRNAVRPFINIGVAADPR